MIQAQTRTRTSRQASPERWQAALARALAEGVTVRQVNDNGMWVATSGSDATMAYLLEITNGVAHRCTCKAGEFGDPVCKHRARWYYDAGLLDLEPEPDPPAPSLAPVTCFRCRGLEPGCPICAGAGVASLTAQATALLAAAA